LPAGLYFTRIALRTSRATIRRASGVLTHSVVVGLNGLGLARLTAYSCDGGAEPRPTRWQLANLYLTEGKADEAVLLLRTVAQEGRRFRAAADQHLDRLRQLGVNTEGE
jgi:hypothetical protein